MKSLFYSLAFSLSIVLHLSACATHPAPTSSAVTPVVSPHDIPAWATPHYLKQLPFALDEVIAPPPADGSEADRKDLAELLEWEKKRTPADCDAAREQEIPTLHNSFAYGPQRKDLPKLKKLSARSLEDLQSLFGRAERDVGFVAHESKWKWARPRPFVRNPELHPCIKRETSYAYPSGHAAFGASGALLLSEILPKYSAAFKRAGEQVGKNRIIGGVHHATDVQAGYEIGRKTLEALRKDPQFIADLEKVKKEVADEHFR